MNEIPFFVHLLLGPLILIVSILFKIFPAKRINRSYGYRTKASMKNQETWDYANTLMNNILIGIGIIICLIQYLLTFFLPHGELIVYVSIILVLALGAMFVIVENYLKKRFDNTDVWGDQE